eukprot:CAMPEP_0117661258 /NCGR_PEP_ID=MMETSP0804-20121206/7442_1 /TAXON_ID=1074897 /ORGANISM="Tetraselmis astigmatica, Strain CCMP880" /LENGTH=467 /DNA_ID=CAMNT_0005468115 /DNA_START=245 /DNA_END=1648 /DNA_ORIENTATION=-
MTTPKKHGNKAPLWQDLLALGISVLGAGAATMLLAKMLDPNRESIKQGKKRMKEMQRALGMNVNLNQYESMLATDVINPDNISVTLEDIGGLSSIVEAMRNNVIAPMQRPDLFLGGSQLLKPTKGILLYGPPGTGKTMLAKALAKESGARFINIKASSIQSKWFGDTSKLVTAIFTLAWKIQPSIIFIDEVDAMLGKRTGQEHDAVTTLKTEFMQMWDGFVTDSYANVIVLAATNRPNDLDEAVLRRLPLSYEVGLPDSRQRESILRVILQNEYRTRGEASMDKELVINSPKGAADGLRPLERLALHTEGYSGSDLMELCKQAACRPVHEYMEQVRNSQADDLLDGPRPLTYADLEAAVPSSRPSLLNAQDFYASRSGRCTAESLARGPSLPSRPADLPPSGSGAGTAPSLEDLAAVMQFFMSNLQQTQPPAASASSGSSANANGAPAENGVPGKPGNGLPNGSAGH